MTTAANTAAWQAHAERRLADSPPQPRQPPTRMQWTSQPDLGPGAEILGETAGKRVLELGCGPSHNLAHLIQHHHALGTGVDAAPAQIHRARAFYGHIEGLTLVTADAAAFLSTTQRTFDIVYCVFGALGLSPPDPILTGVRERLKHDGRLAFSTRPQPDIGGNQPDGPTPDTLALPDGRRLPITRWAPDLPGWADLLTHHGFTTDDQHTVGQSCWIITAHPT